MRPTDQTTWQAHNIEIAGDVAGLWHIDPNHDPTAGVPSRVWISLTERGGTPLALDQVRCNLAVYKQPRGEAIARPTLATTAVDQAHPAVPAAMVTFPSTGAYELELACLPQTGARVAAFTMTYDVTVARSQPVSATPSPMVSATPSPIASPIAEPIAAPQIPLGIFGLGTIGILAIGSIGWVLKGWRGK